MISSARNRDGAQFLVFASSLSEYSVETYRFIFVFDINYIFFFFRAQNYDLRNSEAISSPSTVPPVPPIRDASSLLAGRYITSVGHEKYPSWPSCDPSPCYTPTKSKSWSEDEQPAITNGGYCRDRTVNKPRLSQVIFFQNTNIFAKMILAIE